MFHPPFSGQPPLGPPGPPPLGPPQSWLPPGWTEHKGPNGTPYYYHADSGQSTWVRPMMPLQPPGGPPPGMLMMPPPQQMPIPGMGGPPPQGMMIPPPHPVVGSPALVASSPIQPGPAGDANSADRGVKKAGKVKKEKAVKKTQILETPWFIVVTNLNNTFFYNKETKTSLWVPTPELEKALVQMGEAETEKLKKKIEEEEEEARKRREQEQAQAQGTEMTEDDVAWQLAMMEQDGGGLDQGEDEDESSDDEQMKERLRQLQGLGSSGSTQGSWSAGSSLPLSARYTTPEEKEQAFMAMLRERGVTQFDTWSKVLERTEGDARMLLIADKKARQDLFENFCVIRSAEVEEEKKKKAMEEDVSKSKNGAKGKDEDESESKPSRPEDVYKKLMIEYTTVNSTWLDFYTKYRTDPRFLGLKPGSLREALFRQYLSDLKKGKIKSKAATEKASSSSSSSRDRSSSSRDRKYKATRDEIDEFKSLLKEIRKDILYDHKKYGKVEWRSLKKLIDRDRRYDAVGSSTEREWIFEEYADSVIKG
ncbi:transcription elongation regulator [Actinomortierella ambigua]|nr:transcription elongation regulator [Actinomortierella ambigua]